MLVVGCEEEATQMKENEEDEEGNEGGEKGL